MKNVKVVAALMLHENKVLIAYVLLRLNIKIYPFVQKTSNKI